MNDTNVLFLSEGLVLSSIIESMIFVYGVYILFIGCDKIEEEKCNLCHKCLIFMFIFVLCFVLCFLPSSFFVL